MTIDIASAPERDRTSNLWIRSPFYQHFRGKCVVIPLSGDHDMYPRIYRH